MAALREDDDRRFGVVTCNQDLIGELRGSKPAEKSYDRKAYGS
jgi:hypothetical protein